MQCTKIILFTLNIIFWICGVVMLAVGIWVVVNPTFLSIATVVEKTGVDELKGFVNDPLLRKAAYLIIGIGVFIVLVGFLGCCGVLKSNKCLLFMYTALVGLTLLLELVAGILAIVFMAEIKAEIGENLKKMAKEQYHKDPLFDKAWDEIQTNLQCCGGLGYQDYNGSYYQETTNNTVPETCCKKPPVYGENCQSDAAEIGLINRPNLYTKGCYTAMQEWFKSNAIVMLAIAFGVVAIQVLGLVLGCCLRNQIDNENELA